MHRRCGCSPTFRDGTFQRRIEMRGMGIFSESYFGHGARRGVNFLLPIFDYAHNSWLIKTASDAAETLFLFWQARDEKFALLFLAPAASLGVWRMIDFLGEFHLRQFAFSSRPFSPRRVPIVSALSQNCHICFSALRMRWDLTLDCLIDKCFAANISSWQYK